MFSIEIKTGGSAYRVGDHTVDGTEIARQLRRLADAVDGEYLSGADNGSMNDINGNKTLTWRYDV